MKPIELAVSVAKFVPAAQLEHSSFADLAAASDTYDQVGGSWPEAFHSGSRDKCRQFLSVGPKSHSQLWDPRLERLRAQRDRGRELL